MSAALLTQPAPVAHWIFSRDLDSAFADLRDMGARIVEPIEDKPWGLRQFTFEDADGNRFYVHDGSADNGR